MTKFSKQLLLFKDISGKKIQADFNGGEVSSDAGLLFLRETEAKHGIIGRMAHVLRDRRHPSYTTHQLASSSGYFKSSPVMKMPMIVTAFVVIPF